MQDATDTKTIPLFAADLPVISIEERIDAAVKAILALLINRVPLCVAFSGGKDSSVVANLVLWAASIAAQNGHRPIVIVSSSNTLIENPEILEHVERELARMAAFARRHGIRFNARVVEPTLTSTFQVKILTGRGIPSFPGTSADCSDYGDLRNVNSTLRPFPVRRECRNYSRRFARMSTIPSKLKISPNLFTHPSELKGTSKRAANAA